MTRIPALTVTSLRARLRAVGLTQKQFAAALGVSQRSVSVWARGQHPAYAEFALGLLEERQALQTRMDGLRCALECYDRLAGSSAAPLP